jgi:beta-fructofuranosidase
MILGAGLAGVGPVVLRYRSDDLLDWHYAGVVCSGETGVAWECPQLFPLGAGHVLLASVWDDTRHPAPQHAEVLAGTYRDGRFEPESRTRFDHGADCYAPATMLDRHGRRLAWAWSWEARDVAAQHEQGWAGVLTLPRVLTRGDDGTLRIAPAAELASLRGEGEIRRQQRLQAGESLRLATLGECLELDLRADLARASTISLDLRASPGGEERTTIRFTPATGRLELDRSRASLDPRAAGGVHGGTLALGQGEPLELRVFLDRSIVEVYANERFTVTERIYPTREDSIGLALTAEGGEATIEHLHVWQLDLSL